MFLGLDLVMKGVWFSRIYFRFIVAKLFTVLIHTLRSPCFIVKNKFFIRKIIRFSFSKCFIKKLLETPKIYKSWPNFLKVFTHDSQIHQVKIRQPSLYYTRAMKAPETFVKINSVQIGRFWMFVTSHLFYQTFQKFHKRTAYVLHLPLRWNLLKLRSFHVLTNAI